ncbi:hypothetical protein H634G_08856 [Metarhizium anisopliae BRIP 53293]|uniref:Uncharacterized protein n=1 Tax=Metarhizium anisopliae BRIP 53293 TaxID=1291518 RepID=A0A0D9NNY0_METAN|nr:hypothetical protein H634G_08856 [Metarhizium anisopliae BRIP 53293]
MRTNNSPWLVPNCTPVLNYWSANGIFRRPIEIGELNFGGAVQMVKAMARPGVDRQSGSRKAKPSPPPEVP